MYSISYLHVLIFDFACHILLVGVKIVIFVALGQVVRVLSWWQFHQVQGSNSLNANIFWRPTRQQNQNII
jgi:hypothetical protein